MSFDPIQYYPEDPSSCTITAAARSRPNGPSISHRAHPYPCSHGTHGASSSRRSESVSFVSTSFISPDEVESIRCSAEASSKNVKKKSYKEHNQIEKNALDWLKRRVILNSVTTTGWLRNITAKQKKKAVEYIEEMVGQVNFRFRCNIEATSTIVEWVLKALIENRKELAQTSETLVDYHNLEPSDPNASPLDRQSHMNNRRDDILDPRMPFTYFLHGCEITDTSVFVLLFANPGLEETHLGHWYRSKSTPLRDEDMRNQLPTTPTQMLAQTATAVLLAILRTVSGKTTKSGNPIRFGTDPHADYQEAVHQALVLALASPIHGPALKARLLDLHERGLKILRGALGLDVAVPVVANPVTAEDSEIVRKALQHAQDTGVPSGQGHHDQPQTRGHYATPIVIPSSLNELTLPRADIAPPSTPHQALMAIQSSTANFPPTSAIDSILLSSHLHISHDFGDDFLEFSEGRAADMPGNEMYSIPF